MSRNLTLGLLFAIIAAHVVLAASFASVTPFRTPGLLGGRVQIADVGAPDERQHVNYVLRLAHGGGFPVFDPKDPNLSETLESHQPPLFYFLDAAWGTVMNGYMPPAPPATEGKEMSQDDGLKLRSLNVLIGAFTVGGVFMLAFWSYRKPEIALAAAAFAGLLPMLAALDGAVSNDPLLFCLCTWTLALLAKGVSEGWTTRLALTIGILTGLAILTKTSGIVLLPVILVAVLLKGERPRPSAPQFAAALVPILVLTVPWFVRNTNLYGDPLALGAFGQAFGGTAQAKDLIGSFGLPGYWIDMVGGYTIRSFVGTFGYMDVWLTNNGHRNGEPGLYRAAWLLIAIAAAGWFVAIRQEPKEAKRVHLVNGLFFLAVLLTFLKFNMQYFQAQARYLLPAIGPIAAAVGAGLVALTRDRRLLALGVIVLVFGFLDVFALTRLPGQFAERTGMAQRTP